MLGAPPLAGCLVLDLSQFLAGPFCTQVLADLGARVVKIEPPAGDVTREFPPYFVNGTSAYFLSANRNKHSVVIDLKKPQGVEIFLRLCATADIVIENFRPGVMDRLGIGYETLVRVNPAIVMCSITGFGADGPYAARPAYDMIVQAMSGVMSLTGEPGRMPVRTGVPIGDLAAGMFAATGTVAALFEARTKGAGSHVDISMLDGLVSLLSYLAAYYLVSGDVPGPQGRGHVSIPTYRAFRGSDGVDFVVTANTEDMWRRMCDAIGRPELADEDRFRTNQDRYANRGELSPILENAFAACPADHWIELLRDAAVPVSPINTVEAALCDPQVIHRRMVVTMRDGDDQELSLPGNPIKFTNRAEEPPRWPPGLGEHTTQVLAELLGLTPAEIADLAAAGVVGTS